MSSSEDSDYSPKRRAPQKSARKKVMIMKNKPTIISSKQIEYSSDESDESDESDNESQSDGDDDEEQVESSAAPKQPEVAQSPSGFSLPGANEEPKIFVLVGSCASGKSYMLKYIMQKFGERKHFGFGICLTSTKFTGGYNYLPDKAVRDFDMDYLEKYIKHLRDKIETGKKEHGDEWNLPHNFVIIDDSIGLVNNSGFFANFIGTHRHTRTTVFLLSQMLTAARSVSTVIRSNVSTAMMWPTSMENNLVGLHKSFGGMYKLAEFKKELDKCRERKYSCLVFKNDPGFTTVNQAYCRIAAPANIPDFELRF